VGRGKAETVGHVAVGYQDFESSLAFAGKRGERLYGTKSEREEFGKKNLKRPAIILRPISYYVGGGEKAAAIKERRRIETERAGRGEQLYPTGISDFQIKN